MNNFNICSSCEFWYSLINSMDFRNTVLVATLLLQEASRNNEFSSLPYPVQQELVEHLTKSMSVSYLTNNLQLLRTVATSSGIRSGNEVYSSIYNKSDLRKSIMPLQDSILKQREIYFSSKLLELQEKGASISEISKFTSEWYTGNVFFMRSFSHYQIGFLKNNELQLFAATHTGIPPVGAGSTYKINILDFKNSYLIKNKYTGLPEISSQYHSGNCLVLRQDATIVSPNEIRVQLVFLSDGSVSHVCYVHPNNVSFNYLFNSHINGGLWLHGGFKMKGSTNANTNFTSQNLLDGNRPFSNIEKKSKELSDQLPDWGYNL